MIFAAMNPYAGQSFFSFFSVLGHRMFLFLTGQMTGPLMSDEIQCLVLILLGVSLSFLGSFLVLKQMTMLANALSHTLLVGIVLTFLLFGGGVLFTSHLSMTVLGIAALLTAILTTVLTQGLTHLGKVQEDASIGLVFTTLFALGILLVTLFTRNMHIGVEAVMGNMDALHVDDVIKTGQFALVTGVVFLGLFRGFFASTFDPIFTSVLRWSNPLLNYSLMILTAACAIISFRAVGVLLFLALLVGPVLIARLWVYSLVKLIVVSFFVTVGSSLFSIALSRHILTVYKTPLSTSGLTSTCLFVFYLLLLLLSFVRKRCIIFR